MSPNRKANLAFKDTVRRVAEAVWRLEPGECQPEWYASDPVLHELDGIARLRDITHVLMATTSTKLEKVRSDVQKLNAAARKEGSRGVPVEKWLITELQLNAEHIGHGRKHGVKVLTLDNFRRRFFDGRDYIAKRRQAAFGSARNLQDLTISIPEDEYVELPMVMSGSSDLTGRVTASESHIDLKTLVERLVHGETIVLVGPFGAGKSLTAREVFLRLAKRYLKNDRQDAPVPLALNLREHWGALYGDEVLERHARSIGFAPRENLTIAWRAGIAMLLLDGFDEVASQAIARPSDKNFMRQTRYEALQAVRDLVSKLPSGSGLLVCGRDHYFDNRSELAHALALTSRPFSVVRLGEFTEDQAAEFLQRHAGRSTIPDWLPRKPLILGYLAHQGLIDAVLSIDASRGFGFAWDRFLELVCAREAEHDRAVMDPRTIRRVLERLACIARATGSGTGPLSGLDLSEAYRAETGDTAGEGVLMQLQRLPGLTPREQDPTARSFVDQDLLSALQGSGVARAIAENSTDLIERRWLNGLNREGVRMASYLLRERGFDAPTVIATAGRLCKAPADRSGDCQLAADCVAVALELGRDQGGIDAQGIALAEVQFDELHLEDTYIRNLDINHSAIETITVGAGLRESRVRIVGTLIGRINGVPAEGGLPPGVFLQCEFGRFDDASTNAAVLKLNLPPSMKALMTILRKLYLQAGGGRKLSALRRGLPSGPVLDCVDPVLRILEAEGIITIFNEVAHPVRRQTGRVHLILASGAMSADLIVSRVQSL